MFAFACPASNSVPFGLNLILFVRQLKGKPPDLSSLEGLRAGFVSLTERYAA
jgi:hypothetical protein